MSNVKKQLFLKRYRESQSNQLKTLTAAEFIEILNHFDKDGSGFIDGDELNGFLTEIQCNSISSDCISENIIPESVFNDFKEAFLDAYDINSDGRISVQELAEILPVEECFLFLFQREKLLDNSYDFMKIWTEIDIDKSGFIEANEMKNFVKMAFKLKFNTNEIPESKIVEYSDALLKIFDSNKDGKLQLSEMVRLLPAKENIPFKNLINTCSTIAKKDIDFIFDSYNYNNNDFIDSIELNDFCKDVIELIRKEYTLNEFEIFKTGLLMAAQANKKEKLAKSDLENVLTTLCLK